MMENDLEMEGILALSRDTLCLQAEEHRERHYGQLVQQMYCEGSICLALRKVKLIEIINDLYLILLYVAYLCMIWLYI